MLEELVGRKIVVQSTEPSRIFEKINIHYAGTLASVKDDEIVLGSWNDELEVVLYGKYASEVPKQGVGITTSPNGKCPVHIPREKIKHAYEFTDSELIATGLLGRKNKDQILVSDIYYYSKKVF